MFDEIHDLTDKVICVYINCQIHQAKFAIFSQIHKGVIGHAPPETGVPFTKVYETTFKKLAGRGISLVVALDDINYLFQNGRANEIIYDILRAHEVYQGARTSVLGVLSDIGQKYKLDPKVASIFKPREIFFPPYTKAEMIEILRERARLGFFPGVIDDVVLEKIASYAYEHADLRVGIEILRVSALIAESEASKKIAEAHAVKAYSQSRDLNLKSTLDSLTSGELEIIKAIVGSGKMDSGELYEAVKKKGFNSYSTFYRALDRLETLRLVDTQPAIKGKKGRTRIVSLHYNKQDVFRAIGK
jgi:cell division control protein 6